MTTRDPRAGKALDYYSKIHINRYLSSLDATGMITMDMLVPVAGEMTVAPRNMLTSQKMTRLVFTLRLMNFCLWKFGRCCLKMQLMIRWKWPQVF
jgi:hypothetical protein